MERAIPEISKNLEKIFADVPTRLVFSKPPKNGDFRKINIAKKQHGYQAEKFTEKQVFHENFADGQAAENFCETLFGQGWGQLNAWSGTYEYSLSLSKKGKILFGRKRLSGQSPKIEESHDKKKNYIIAEDKPFPALVDMGIFTKEGKVAKPMYDKFRQINRFAEIIDDAVREKKFPDGKIRVVDFGCGKSYLTFVLYHYFTEILGLEADMLGLDLKADVIEKCNAAAARYGYTGLRFEVGDIGGAARTEKTDMVVTLHACDTATDFALYNAVTRGAEMIFSVPCCQHELNGQMRSENFSILTRYGIVKERVAALCTDAIRANLLEYCGYKTQLLEFIDFEHTPKNILIRAVKRESPPKNREKYLAEAERLMEEFSFEPTLYQLIINNE
ncbi:MAG: SAM-dependent methyltransferase [Ruminococcus sp.]|nr:SAM-dependent methyltransferase [Ruminococcus sp.]MCM1480836.1 SAM-dependent methyltransferase [Muribaculaceae bacterium]